MRYELRIDTAHNYFHFLGQTSMSSTNLSGSYVQFRKNLFLVPNSGFYLKEEIARDDSTYEFHVYDGMKKEPVSSFHLKQKLPLYDTLILDSHFSFTEGKEGRGISIFSISYQIYFFELETPGRYDIYLYPGNYNEKVLYWKIGKDKVVSDKLILEKKTAYNSGLLKQIRYEQIALEHFFNKVFYEEYPKVKRLECNGLIENTLSRFASMKDCFDKNQSIRHAMYAREDLELDPPQKMDFTNLKKIHISRQARYVLRVFSVNEINGFFYVRVDMTKKNYHTDAWFFKLDKEGTIVDWCKSGVIY
ncbi:MAG: hypothetical protein KDE26_07240 [Bacteroidetes bacterium]|nr:hypothetical protein [Bacteroidota bacterium]